MLGTMMRVRRQTWLALGLGAFIGLAAIGGAMLAFGEDDGSSCREGLMMRRLPGLTGNQQPRAVPRSQALAWASEQVGFEVLAPCYLPGRLELVEVAAHVQPTFQASAQILLARRTDRGNVDSTGPGILVSQRAGELGPRQDGATAVAFGMEETAAYLQPGDQDPGGTVESVRYLVERGGMTFVIEAGASGGDLPSDSELRRMIRSMFE